MCQVRGSVVSWQLAGYAGGSFWGRLGVAVSNKTDGVRPGSGRQLQHSAEVQGLENEGNRGRPSRATSWSCWCCCWLQPANASREDFGEPEIMAAPTTSCAEGPFFFSKCDTRKLDCDEGCGREGRIDTIRVLVVKEFRGAAGPTRRGSQEKLEGRSQESRVR